MDEITLKKLEESFLAGDTDAAKKIVTDLVSKELTDEEKGNAYLDITELYLDLMNKIEEDHKDALKEVLDEIQRMLVQKKHADTDDKLEEIRRSLAE